VLLLSLLIVVGRVLWLRRGGRSPAATSELPRGPERRATLFVTLFFLAGFALWEMKFSISRYMVPLELLAPLVGVAVMRISLPERASLVLAPLSLGLAAFVLLRPAHVERTEWTSTLFNVNAPRFEHPEEVMVILADRVPMSYIIPFFQPEVRFVCPWNNFTDDETIEYPPRIFDEMVNVIRAHQGPIYGVAPGNLRNAKSYGVAPPLKDGRRAFYPVPLSSPVTGPRDAPPTGLFIQPLTHAPVKKPRKP
jgi:hypothetical protein